MSIKIPVVSLFSGAGGLDIGFEQAGFKVILAADLDRAACQTYIDNLGHDCLVMKADLSTLPAVSIANIVRSLAPKGPLGVIGGPPCQGFSQANVHKRSDDSRLFLLDSYADILAALSQTGRLDFFVFENVEGILGKRHQVQFSRFLTRLKRMGFFVTKMTLDASDFGVPQVRRRVFLIGFNKRYHEAADFKLTPSPRRKLTVRDAIWGLGAPTHFKRGLEQASFPKHPNHWCMAPKSEKFLNGHKFSDATGRSFRKLKWESPSPTVAYGHNEVHVHPSGGRRISVLEGMLLQGFPKSYRLRGALSHQLKLVSNAVPPPLARAIARKVHEKLSPSRSQSKHAGHKKLRQ